MIRELDIGTLNRLENAKVIVRDVSRRFGEGDRSVLALDDVSVVIGQNDFFCLVGPSGCGKSTLLNLIAGFDEPSSGSLLMDDRSIKGPSAERGVVFQHGALFTWLSVLENIAFGPRCKGKPVREARDIARHYLKIVGLEGFEHRYPYELSGGMQQRVGIARVLANDPEIMLMDEPFAALDAQTRELLQEEMKTIWRQTEKTIFWITHSIDEALFLANRIVVMTARPGRVKAGFEASFGDALDYRITTSPEFTEAKRTVVELLREETMTAQKQSMLESV